MFPPLAKKSNLIILATAVTVVAIFVVFVLSGGSAEKTTVPRDGTVVETPETQNFWSRLFAEKSKPIPVLVKEIVNEVEEPIVLGVGFSADIQAALKPLWITSDITLLQGEGFFYVEDGVLYRTKLKDGVAVERGQKVAEGMHMILEQSDKMVLFTDLVKVPEGMHGPLENDLWAIDKETGTAKKIYQDVQSANISPKGNMIAVSTASVQVHLIDMNGNLLNTVGFKGRSGSFSPDGGSLAYQRLPDSYIPGDMGEDPTSSNNGIAVYNINTGKDVLATNSFHDYAPLTFSLDGRYVYFKSGREPSNYLWVADVVKGGEPIGLSKDPIPFSGNSAEWSSDRQSVLSVGDEGEALLVKISDDSKSLSVHTIGDNRKKNSGFPRWVVQDKIVEFKGKDGEWKTVDVSALVSK